MNPNVWANESDIDAPHGIWLTTGDIDNLKHFIQDFTIRSLIPYVERQVMLLNEAVRTDSTGILLNEAHLNSNFSDFQQKRSQSIAAERHQTLVRYQ